MLIDIEQLKTWTGYERPADIKRWLDRHRITWLPTKDGGVCTTLDWIKESQYDEHEKIVGF